MKLSMGQHLRIKRLKAANPGASYRYIAIKVGATEKEIRDALSAGTVASPRRKIKRIRKEKLGKGYIQSGRVVAGIANPEEVSVPTDVIDDRERRMATSPRSMTAAWQGDPLPGYSALDKRHGA